MPNWNDLVSEIGTNGSPYDVIRRKYLPKVSDKTGRNTIAYYSGWLQKPELLRQGMSGFEINDADKNGFMAMIHQMDRTKGLDLILHTPGGDAAATESLVDYLRSMFGTNIRVIVPQLAMSAGTMMALASKEIIMGKHSSLGPIDPQVGGVPAHGVIEEFNLAKSEVAKNQSSALIWQPIIAKYSPTLIGQCTKAIQWANAMVKDWLVSGMFAGDANAAAKADTVVAELGSHSVTLSHARHYSLEKIKNLKLNVVELEADNDLQDAVLTVHHAFVQTLTMTPAFKIIQNDRGNAYVLAVRQALVQ